MNASLKQQVRLPLFFCRLSLFLVYLAWTWDKLFNAAHGAGIMNRHYGWEFVTPQIVFFLGFVELVFILALLLGFFKRPVRLGIIIFSLVSAFGPMVRSGYIVFLQMSEEDAILDSVSHLFLPYYLMPTLCMVIASIVVYAMRDYDTLFSFSKQDKALNA